MTKVTSLTVIDEMLPVCSVPMPAAGWFCHLIHNLSALLSAESVAQDTFWAQQMPFS